MLQLPGMSLVYDNFELYNPILSLDMIVWSLFAGLTIGAVLSFLNNRIVGSFVRALLKNTVHTEKDAKTLGELGFSRNLFIRWSLREGKTLRRLIRCANEDEMPVVRVSKDGEKTVRMDMKTARFYIPEEMRISAELRYEDRGGSVVSLILSILLLAAMALGVLYVLPELLQLLDNFLTVVG